MPSYYVPSPHSSHHGHQPVMYPSYGGGGDYLSPQHQYAGSQPYVMSSHSSRSGRHHSSQPYYDDGHRSHGRSHSHGHGHGHSHSQSHHHHKRSLGDRILRWFGVRRHSSRSRSSKGWSFFGPRRHRAKYIDTRTGLEVDRQGRPVYKV